MGVEKLEYLSINLQTIIMEIMNNSNIMNLLESESPLLPYPFNTKTTDTTSCEIRVYYPSLDFNNEHIQEVTVLFDIICSKSLWTKDGNIRPYEIMRHLINSFLNKTIFEVGKLRFNGMRHVTVNDSYEGLRISARMIQA